MNRFLLLALPVTLASCAHAPSRVPPVATESKPSWVGHAYAESTQKGFILYIPGQGAATSEAADSEARSNAADLTAYMMIEVLQHWIEKTGEREAGKADALTMQDATEKFIESAPVVKRWSASNGQHYSLLAVDTSAMLDRHTAHMPKAKHDWFAEAFKPVLADVVADPNKKR